MVIFHSRSSYSRFSIDSFNNLFIHISQSINKLGLISIIVYLLNTYVTFIHVFTSSFGYLAASVQDPSEQLPHFLYLVQLLS